MKKMIVIVCLYTICIGAFGQKALPDAVPISKVDALKFKTVLEVYGLPPAFTVVAYTIVFAKKGEIFRMTFGSDMTQPACVQHLSSLTSGDEFSFQDVIIKRGDRQIKLPVKNFVIR